MPKILELKNVEGKIWAQLDLPFGTEAIHLLTQSEIDRIRIIERNRIIEAISDLDRSNEE